MFPFDSRAAAQMFEADLIVAHQRRTRGPVVTERTRRWRSLFARSELPWTATHELFAGLGRTQLNRAAEKFTVRDVDPGTSLGSQGSVASEFVAILHGRIGVTINGAPHAVLDDGSHFGSIPLLDDQPPTLRASFSVMAPSRIATASPTQFRTLLAEHPVVADRIRVMADIRRAYLAGVAAVDSGERLDLVDVARYPAHMVDADITL